MDFEARQKGAVLEINAVLAKFGLGLNAHLDGYPNALIPKIKFVELKKEEEKTTVDEKDEKTVKTKKTKKSK